MKGIDMRFTPGILLVLLMLLSGNSCQDSARAQTQADAAAALLANSSSLDYSLTDLEYRQLPELRNPNRENSIFHMECIGERLFIGADDGKCGLHCYGLPGNRRLWSACLGSYEHVCEEENEIGSGNKQSTPYALLPSADGRKLFVAYGGFDTCGPAPQGIVALDSATGLELSRLELTDYQALELLKLDGRELLLAVGSQKIRMLDQENIANELLVFTEAELAERQMAELLEQDGYSEGFVDLLGESELPAVFGPGVLDAADAALICQLPAAKEIARYRFSLEQGAVACRREASAECDFDEVYNIVLLPESGTVAVLDWKSGDVQIHDSSSLELLDKYITLPFARTYKAGSGKLLLASTFFPEDDNEADEDYDDSSLHSMVRLQLLDPLEGPGPLRLVDDAMLETVYPVNGGRKVLLFSEGLMKTISEEDDSGSTSMGSTLADGRIVLLDMDSGGMSSRDLPDGCSSVAMSARHGLFYFTRYSQQLEGPSIQPGIRVCSLGGSYGGESP